MTWVKISDTYAEDPRWDTVGYAALALDIAAKCFCNRNLTDGKLSRARLARLIDVPDPQALIDAMIVAGFFTENGPDIEIVNYFDTQLSAEKIRTIQAQARDRQQRWRDGTGRYKAKNANPSEPPIVDLSNPTNASRNASRNTAPAPPR